VIGPKIDFRFVLDINDEEVDVGAGKVARASPTNTKIHDDEGKLVKEGKDIVDGLVNRIHDIQIEMVWGQIIQIAGTCIC
jgi:hypothetical protein